ncbi:MAG TPA: trypsin-like peptidase domain-containing protein [Acidimicrobiia bacterium]|nr:trypsin-like peptidase domain-containing protein [Acidimicrobiia bacterium]
MSDPEGDESAAERDPTSSGPRPNPMDRPWVHPSELHSIVANPLPPPQVRPREWVIGVVSALAGITATLLVLVAFGALGERNRAVLPPPVFTNANSSVNYRTALEVNEEVSPSIVTVRAVAGDTTTYGSGVAVKSDRVITSAHLIVNASTVTLLTRDNRTLGAKIIGADADTDLALLQVVGGTLAFRPLARTDPTAGLPVVGVANLRGKTWLGIDIISLRNQVATTATGTSMWGLLRADLLTTPETSGGGLFDADGELVGILTSPPGVPVPGLAVPIAVADDVSRQLEATGKVIHGWVGATAEDSPDPPGAKIVSIVPGSPAAQAKLEPGDVVTRAGGQPVTSYGDFMAAWRGRNPGDSLSVVVHRGHQDESATVTVGNDPSQAPTATTAAPAAPANG